MRSRPAALLLAVALLLLGGAATASAHGDTGTMEVLVAEAPDGREARVEVGVLHLDGDQATEATVTATLVGPDGATSEAVTLSPVSGARYGATIPVTGPGQWTLEATSTDPAATARQAFTVPEPEATTTTAETASVADGGEPVRVLPEESESRWSAILLGVAVLVAAIVIGFLLARRRRR